MSVYWLTLQHPVSTKWSNTLKILQQMLQVFKFLFDHFLDTRRYRFLYKNGNSFDTTTFPHILEFTVYKLLFILQRPLTIFTKSSTLDIWQVSEYEFAQTLDVCQKKIATITTFKICEINDESSF